MVSMLAKAYLKAAFNNKSMWGRVVSKNEAKR